MFSWLLVIKDRRNHDLIVEGHTDGNHMYRILLDDLQIPTKINLAKIVSMQLGMHHRLSHPSKDVTRRMIDSFNLLVICKTNLNDCSSCTMGKLHCIHAFPF